MLVMSPVQNLSRGSHGNAEGRTPQACDGCRRSKTKCTGNRPQCRRCLKRRVTCSWPSSPAFEFRSLNTSEDNSTAKELHDVTSSPDIEINSRINLTFPAANLLERLLSIFFARHHDVELCSFLHKPTTSLADLSAQSPFLVSAIISLSTLYISDIEASKEFGFETAIALSDHFAKHAIRFANSLSDKPSVSTIQAYLILAVREHVTWTNFKAWMYAGIAIRMAQALRLGSEFNQRHSPRQKEVRRRTFWACFVVDRLISYSCNHPFTIDMLTVRIQVPSPDNTFAFEEAYTGPCLDKVIKHTNELSRLGVAPFYISMLRLWGDMALLHVSGGRRRMIHVPTDPANEFHRHNHAIEEFTSSLPSALLWSKRNYQLHQSTGHAQAFVNFNFLLHHSRCVMHQEYLPQLDLQYNLNVPSDEEARCDAAGLPFEYSNKSIIDACIVSSDAITEIATTLYHGSDQEREHLQSIIVANALITAAAVNLWVAYTQTCKKCPKHIARSRFVQIVEILKSWEPRWRVAFAWTETLEMLYRLYEYSYGTDILPDFTPWQTLDEASGSAELVEEPTGADGGHPGLSNGDGIPDPGTVCQRLHDKIRNILLNPLLPTDVKKKNLRVFCQSLWQHLWYPGTFETAEDGLIILDDAMGMDDFAHSSASEYQ